MENYQKIYQQLERGEKLPMDFETSFLFDMASQFAVNGNFEAKVRIYEEFIFKHTRATDDDKTRVLVYRADLRRRNGDPKGALEVLRVMQPPTGSMALAEWLQAAGQCHLMLGSLQEALKSQKQIIELFVGGKISPDKQLYYLETLMAMKLRANEADEELENLFETYEHLIEESSFSASIKERAQAALEILRGRHESDKGNLAAAVNHYWKCFELGPATRDKVVAALEFLYCCWQIDPNDNSSFVQIATEFFENHRERLQPTDIVQLQKEVIFVNQKLGLI